MEFDVYKNESQKELLDQDKDVYFLMNSMINSYNFVENHIFELNTFDNFSQINSNLSSKKKSFDFSSSLDNKRDKKSFKRYNTDHILSVYKTNTKINNLNNIMVMESTDFAGGNKGKLPIY